MNIRLTTELRSKLQRLADADGRKLSNYIERVLSAHAKAESPCDEARDPAPGASDPSKRPTVHSTRR